jgi:hypothetical protein
MLELAPKPRSDPAPSPQTWRNFYRVYHVLQIVPLDMWFPGVHAGPRVFESRESAEQNARAFLSRINPPGRWIMDFAGAFPESDTPN